MLFTVSTMRFTCSPPIRGLIRVRVGVRVRVRVRVRVGVGVKVRVMVRLMMKDIYHEEEIHENDTERRKKGTCPFTMYLCEDPLASKYCSALDGGEVSGKGCLIVEFVVLVRLE
jgi:hypothetical protein